MRGKGSGGRNGRREIKSLNAMGCMYLYSAVVRMYLHSAGGCMYVLHLYAHTQSASVHCT